MPGPGSGAKRPASRPALLLACVPVAFLVAAVAYPSRQYHWDTLERAYLLEHPARYMRSWDGSPRSQFLSFAHVLELPLGAVVRTLLPGSSGLRALVVLEAAAAGATLLLVGLLVRFWRGTGDVLGGVSAVLFAQGTLAASLAFWKMGSSGEEKILALGSQLLFLWIYWHELRDDSARDRAGVAWPVAVALVGAVLAHTTGAVLAPFALLGLVVLPEAWRPRRAPVARGILLGTFLTVVAFYAIAAWTTHVRGPREFFAYLTFFHRAGGNNFFEPTGAVSIHGARVVRCLRGLGSFFAGDGWAQSAAIATLVAVIAAPLVRARGLGAPQATVPRHAFLLGALWALHFAFFEPEKHESWTLPAVLLAIVAAASLPARRSAWAACALPAFLLVVNQRHHAANHRPMPLEAYRRVVDHATRPGDIVVLVGGMQNGRSLRGSLWMRYFLATQRGRTLASLYDVLGVTQPEFWDRPFESPAALQAALDAGRRAYAPASLQPEIEGANSSGLVRVTWTARGDSLLEITRIEGLMPKQPAAGLMPK